jgi:hypothetical protein
MTLCPHLQCGHRQEHRQNSGLAEAGWKLQMTPYLPPELSLQDASIACFYEGLCVSAYGVII